MWHPAMKSATPEPLRTPSATWQTGSPGASIAIPSPFTPSIFHAARARVGPRSGPPCFLLPPTIVGAICPGPADARTRRQATLQHPSDRTGLLPRSAARELQETPRSVLNAHGGQCPQGRCTSMPREGGPPTRTPAVRIACARDTSETQPIMGPCHGLWPKPSATGRAGSFLGCLLVVAFDSLALAVADVLSLAEVRGRT
jgi:hypothetical protein